VGFPWYIAKRYFLAKHRFGFISTISRISIFGLAIGIAALLITVSILAGFKSNLEQKIIGFDGHIRLRYFHKNPLQNLPEVENKLREFPEIRSASPYISHEAMIRAKSFTDGVVVEAMPETTIQRVLSVGDFITRGRLRFNPENMVHGLLISERLGSKIHAAPGDTVVLFSIDGVPGPYNRPKAQRFVVQAMFRTGMSDYDDVFVYTSLIAGQQLFRLPDQAQGMLLMLHNPDQVEPFAMHLQDTLGYPYYAVTWFDRHTNLFAWLQSQQYPIIIVFGLIALVALFNIMSTLMMIVIEKERDIGVLKAVGSSNRKILRIFMLDGLIIGLSGCTLGTSFTLILGYLQQQFHFIHIPADIYFMDALPFEFHWQHFVIINGIALLFATLATLYPAFRAARKKPVESIVHE